MILKFVPFVPGMESSLISMESGKADIQFSWDVAGVSPAPFTVVYVERSWPLATGQLHGSENCDQGIESCGSQ